MAELNRRPLGQLRDDFEYQLLEIFENEDLDPGNDFNYYWEYSYCAILPDIGPDQNPVLMQGLVFSTGEAHWVVRRLEEQVSKGRKEPQFEICLFNTSDGRWQEAQALIFPPIIPVPRAQYELADAILEALTEGVTPVHPLNIPLLPKVVQQALRRPPQTLDT